MRIRFSREVMADANSWRTLDRMVMHIEDRRHEWLADNPDEIEASPWMGDSGRSGQANRKAYQEHVRWAAYPKKRIELTVALNTASVQLLSPPDALRSMETPVFVAVENATGDGGFLVTTILALNRTELWEALERGWVAIDQMGGYGECEKTIIRLRENVAGPVRVFVLADSDSRFPGELTQTVTKVKESCVKTGAHYAILKKRKIENYLPDAVLENVNKTAYRALKKLTWDQRDHYEMKYGFQRDNNNNVLVSVEQTPLFAGVDYHTLRGLIGGFGKDISTLFVAHRHSIQEVHIRQVCASDPTELDRVLNEIEKLL